MVIAKSNANGFNLQTLKLRAKTKRTKISQAYISWEEILFGVPQGSILGLILFNIFPRDLCLVVQDMDFVFYADDNTIYAADESIDDLILSLQESFKNF